MTCERSVINETEKHGKELDLIDVALGEYPQNLVLTQLKNELVNGSSNNNAPTPNPVNPEANSNLVSPEATPNPVSSGRILTVHL